YSYSCGSDLRPSNARATPRQRPGRRISRLLIPKDRLDSAALELGPAAERHQLEQERETDDGSAQTLDQPGGRGGRAAGGDHVVDDQHPLARVHRVAVDLEQIVPVLEGVLLAFDVPRQ